jgi:drug/metabolite transporter (DMT)-like permease
MLVPVLDAPPSVPGATRRERRAGAGYAMTLAAATLFAVNGSVSKLALDASGMGTLRWTELRSTGAFLGLLVALLCLAPARLRVDRQEALSLVLYGVVGFVLVQWLYFVAIYRLPIGIGLLLEFTAPVLVVLWVRFAWREHVSRRVWPALALVLVGLALVSEAWSGIDLDGIGVAAGFAAAVALALYYLAGERLVTRRDPHSLVCLAIGASAGFWAVVQPWWSFPFGSLLEDVDLPGGVGLTAPVWSLALWMIVLGTIAPFVLSIGALRHLPATAVTVVATFEPVAAAVVAWAWLGETLAAVQVVGGAVVLVGILLAETSRQGAAR